MAENSPEAAAVEEVDLRDPLVAAGLALLWPGAGHLYQRRWAKGVLFSVCIVGTFLFGWDLGGQKVVYASWRSGDRRWPYLCQVWVGLPAWPALVQAAFDQPLGDDFMRAPSLVRTRSDAPNELDLWHQQYHTKFEMGTVFTMIAGLLNILVIFDAAAGPVGSSPRPSAVQRSPKRRKEPGGEPGEAERLRGTADRRPRVGEEAEK
ncbi:MAG: hypothetical protein GTO03_07695 [Planctomycetales bacterium]|nr:hypothetical protein [Planctomycetales bacterium]